MLVEVPLCELRKLNNLASGHAILGLLRKCGLRRGVSDDAAVQERDVTGLFECLPDKLHYRRLTGSILFGEGAHDGISFALLKVSDCMKATASTHP